MKNSLRILLTSVTTISLLLSGCSLSNTGAPEATEFLNDNEKNTEDDLAAESESADAASKDKSIIVVDNLIEPILEAVEGDTASSDSDNTAATADSSDISEASSSEKSSEAPADASSEATSEADAETSVDTAGDSSKAKNKSKDKDKNKSKDSSSEDASENEKKDDNKVRIVFMGDSQIAGGRKDQTDIATYVGKRVPNSVVYNLGIGGTTGSVEATTSEVDPSDLHSSSFLGMTYCLAGKSDRSATLSATAPEVLDIMNTIDPKEVDYYFIGYGTNDFINNVKLDTSFYDTDGEQAHVFFNAMCKGIDVLKDISPNAQFIIITPFYGIYVAEDGSYIGDSYIVSNGTGTLADYARKAINVAEEKDLYSFDGMFISKCDLYLDTADAYLSDHLHLNGTGRQIMGRLLAHYVNYMENNEPFAYLDSDFIKISEFDPDEYYRLDEHVMKNNYPESWEKYIKGEFPLAQPSEEAVEKYLNNENEDKKEEKDDD